MNGYELTRKWFDFAFENQGLVNPNHTAMYLWFVELNNRMGWVKNFASPASQTMSAIGIKSYNTYKKAYKELIEFGFIIEVKASSNQYQSCIIALSNFDKPLNKSLDKSLTLHLTNQSKSTQQIKESIIKQETSKPLNKKPKTINNHLLSEIKISDVDLSEVEYFEIAKAFQQLFIKNLKTDDAPTNNQEKATYKNYVTPIRLMMQNDGVTKDQLTVVFKYLGSPDGKFWASNVLSTKKLREKIATIISKSKENGNRNNSNYNGNKSSIKGTFDAIDRMFGDK